MKVIPYEQESGGYIIECPGCRCYHLLDPRWVFNGDQDNPSFIGPGTTEGCMFSITNGRIEYSPSCSHDLKGQIVDLPEIEWPIPV